MQLLRNSSKVFVKVVAQAGRLSVSVVEEPRVAVDRGVGPLCENPIDGIGVQLGVKLSPVGALNAVCRPENLSQTLEFDSLAWCSSLVVGGEATMVVWMPVLSRHDEIEVGCQLIGEWYDRIALWNGECTAGDKVVLDVDE